MCKEKCNINDIIARASEKGRLLMIQKNIIKLKVEFYQSFVILFAFPCPKPRLRRNKSKSVSSRWG